LEWWGSTTHVNLRGKGKKKWGGFKGGKKRFKTKKNKNQQQTEQLELIKKRKTREGGKKGATASQSQRDESREKRFLQRDGVKQYLRLVSEEKREYNQGGKAWAASMGAQERKPKKK